MSEEPQVVDADAGDVEGHHGMKKRGTEGLDVRSAQGDGTETEDNEVEGHHHGMKRR